MSKNPQIAVLMPVYNPDEDLNLTLDSLRAQTVPFRLFLVDDGSKAHTDYESLCENIDVKIIRLAKNLGITGAMNMGLTEILTGQFKYIARIDCGDICVAERFAKQFAFLEKHGEISTLGTACEFRDRNEKNELLYSRIITLPSTPEESRKRLYFNSPVCHPAMMVRREVFEKIGFYSENYPAAEDYDLMWRINNAGLNIVNIPDVLLIKEVTPGSISLTRRRRQIFSRLRIQWANANLLSFRTWAGLVKTIVILAAPAQMVNAIKRLVPNS
jgi:GT2 family glycosyltransferase